MLYPVVAVLLYSCKFGVEVIRVYGRAYSESVWDVPGHIRCSLRTSEPLLPALLQDMDALSFVCENLIFLGGGNLQDKWRSK